MDYTCTLCNHFEELNKKCPQCGSNMENLGLLQDYYDPYSPYLDQEIYQDNYKKNNNDLCVHLLHCDGCGFEDFYPYKRQAV